MEINEIRNKIDAICEKYQGSEEFNRADLLQEINNFTLKNDLTLAFENGRYIIKVHVE